MTPLRQDDARLPSARSVSMSGAQRMSPPLLIMHIFRTVVYRRRLVYLQHVRDGVVAATAPSGKAATLVEGVFGHAAPVTEGDGNSRQGASGSDQARSTTLPTLALR